MTNQQPLRLYHILMAAESSTERSESMLTDANKQSRSNTRTDHLSNNLVATSNKLDVEGIEDLIKEISALKGELKRLNKEKIEINRNLKQYQDQLSELMTHYNLNSIVKDGIEYTVQTLSKKKPI